MSKIAFLTSLNQSWTQIEPLQLGRGPNVNGTPDRYVALESSEGLVLRVDLYRSSDESFAFEEVCIWSSFAVIGWGHHVYLVDIPTRSVSGFDLGSYFGHLYPAEGWLLAASAERLWRVGPDGSRLWRSDVLGIDGVVVHQIEDGVIHGAGECDPPGGWQPFELDLDTGQRA